MISRNACSSNTRISKLTVLALLQAATAIGVAVGEKVQYTTDRNRVFTYKVVKYTSTTVDLDTGTEVITVPMSRVKSSSTHIFLDKLTANQWEITSFDPDTRTVCVAVEGKVRSYLSFKLPA